MISKSKTMNGFLVKLSLCLMIALLASGCSSLGNNHRTISGEQSETRVQDSGFYKHKVDRTLFY